MKVLQRNNSQSFTRRQQLVNDLVQLIRIHSENPGPGEGDVAEWIRSKFASLGLRTILQKVSSNRPNLVGTLEPKKRDAREKRRGILVNGHMDTVRLVEADEWSHDPYAGEIEGSKIFGLGSCDMKAGLACMISIAADLVEGGYIDALEEPIAFTAVCDEEGKDIGAEHLVRSRLIKNYRGGIVMEPTSLKISIAQNGFTDYQVVCLGKAAHSSRPRLGKNAIYGMNEFLRLLLNYERRTLSSIKNDLIGCPTINVGYIEGGENVEIASIVPEKCAMVFERRLVPNEKIADCDKEIRILIAQARKTNGDFRFQVHRLFSMPPLAIRQDSRIVSSIENHRSKFIIEKGNSKALIGVPYYTEAEVFTHRGKIPTVVFGPGSISAAHSVDEHVDVKDMIRAIQIIRSFLLDECFAALSS